MLTLPFVRKAKHRRRAIDRIVSRCFTAAAAVKDPGPTYWPLARGLGNHETTLPSGLFHLAELVGGYVRLRATLVTGSGATVGAGAVLPVVACDLQDNTVTLQLAEGRPGVQISGVPRNQVDVVRGRWT